MSASETSADTVNPADTTSDSSSGTSTESAETTPTPEPTPEPEPEPAPEPSGGFAWIPGANSVSVVIPASLPHWQFHVFSLRKHYTLYGPDNRGGNREETITYTLPGGGESWRQKSLNAGDDGTLLVYINTRDAQYGGDYRSAGWRIMNPSAAQYGDGDRLQEGEDH